MGGGGEDCSLRIFYIETLVVVVLVVVVVVHVVAHGRMLVSLFRM
jgi:hypothetical protein